jgi:hypothetical protein
MNRRLAITAACRCSRFCAAALLKKMTYVFTMSLIYKDEPYSRTGSDCK